MGGVKEKNVNKCISKEVSHSGKVENRCFGKSRPIMQTYITINARLIYGNGLWKLFARSILSPVEFVEGAEYTFS